MKIESKYNLGDIVYTVQKTQVFEDCTVCDGEGTVDVQVKEGYYRVFCPNCKGHKTVATTTDKLWVILEKVFVGIGLASPIAEAKYEIQEIIANERGISYKVRLYNEDANLSRFTRDRLTKTISEELLFLSKVEAQAYCDKMNQQEEDVVEDEEPTEDEVIEDTEEEVGENV